MIKIGTSGFDYADWKGQFYPESIPRSSWLSYYADHFNCLELNFSYYRMPTAGQLESMLKRSDGKVEFSIKAHRSMTHERTAVPREYEQFCEALRPLQEAGRLGAVLAQFPYSFKQTEENRSYVRRLADQLPSPLVLEFRERQWATPRVHNWLTRVGVGYCCVDEPQIEGLMPSTAAMAAEPAYVRFHGRNAAKWYNHNNAAERYNYRYSIPELQEWVPRIRELDRQSGNVLVFFNNHFQSKAVESAKALGILLSK